MVQSRNKMREAFEEWFADTYWATVAGVSGLARKPNIQEEYAHLWTQMCWDAWVARDQYWKSN